MEDPSKFDPNKKLGVNVDENGNEVDSLQKQKMEQEFRQNVEGQSDDMKI